jgi:hypothetical protein
MAENVNYDIDYDDKRFTQVESDKSAALNKVNAVYDNMINQSDQYYQAQIDATKEWGETQAKNQQERTDFTIEQINQQKEQTKKDYTKEQSGAYVDWQKQSGEYGANAEMMAAQGMTGTGYSESAQVSMYNTYQNRVATARESYNRAVLNYDNAIKDAQLQNNAALAEIAYNSLKTQLELSLEGFQYKNSLIMAKTDKGMEIDDTYYGRYQDVLKQINTENALAEEVRQYNESLAEEQRQYNESLALEKSKFAYQKAQDAKELAEIDKGGGSPKKYNVKGNSDNSAYWSKKENDIKTDSHKSKLEVDTASIKALGLGNLTSEQLNRYISMGYVQEFINKGKLTYKLSPQGKKYKNMHESRL